MKGTYNIAIRKANMNEINVFLWEEGEIKYQHMAADGCLYDGKKIIYVFFYI